MPLEETVNDKEIQWWLGSSYFNLGMHVLGKKYLEVGIDKYHDAWCAYSLGWWYRHSDKDALGLTFNRAKDLLLMGVSATKASYDELGALYEDVALYDEAIKYYKQSQTQKGTSSIARLVINRFAQLSNDDALYYIKKAVDDGDLDALYGLGMITYHGQYGVPANRKQGRELVSQAAQKGHKKAKSILYTLSSY